VLVSYGTMSRQRLKSAMETAQMEKQQVSIQSKKLSERIQSQMSMLVAHKTQSQQRIVELSNELQQTKDRASKIQLYIKPRSFI
jgi:chromosome segregation ATPase